MWCAFVIVSMILFTELLKSIDDVARDQYGRKVLLYLLAPRSTKYFHPDIIKKLVPGDSNPHRSVLLEPK